MEIELYSIIAAVILIAVLITALFTLVAYIAFQIRKRRKAPVWRLRRPRARPSSLRGIRRARSHTDEQVSPLN